MESRHNKGFYAQSMSIGKLNIIASETFDSCSSIKNKRSISEILVWEVGFLSGAEAACCDIEAWRNV